MMVKVNEIFHSIQGESVHAGLPCVFIRLTGCNLCCRYCDTPYAHNEGQDMPVAHVIDAVRPFGCRLVAVTGGEPLIQTATTTLIETLLENRFHVLMETNGSLDIDRVNRRCSRIMDIKCPSSGEAKHFAPANLDRLTPHDQVKFVIGDETDFQFAVSWLPRLPQWLPMERILFSAVAGRLAPAQLAHWIVESRIQVRLQIQLHRLLWPDRDRGV